MEPGEKFHSLQEVPIIYVLNSYISYMKLYDKYKSHVGLLARKPMGTFVYIAKRKVIFNNPKVISSLQV